MSVRALVGSRERVAWIAGFLSWGVIVAFGFCAAMQWDSRPGPAGLVPRLEPGHGAKPWLIVALHSQCPCSLATLDNLIAIPQEERRKVRITLVFTGPDPHHSRLIETARALPDAEQEFLSEDAVLARYGARTSGQALFYDLHGKLVFSGGLTDSRGESGESVGIDAVKNAIAGRKCIDKLPVYGCALQTPR